MLIYPGNYSLRVQTSPAFLTSTYLFSGGSTVFSAFYLGMNTWVFAMFRKHKLGFKNNVEHNYVGGRLLATEFFGGKKKTSTYMVLLEDVQCKWICKSAFRSAMCGHADFPTGSSTADVGALCSV